jgi:hypothetical protein
MSDIDSSTGSRVVIVLAQDGGASRVCFQQDCAATEIPLGIEPAAVAKLFRRYPPLEADLEKAIDVVEDAVMPLGRRLPPNPSLVAGDAATQRLARLSMGDGAGRTATLQAIEALFEQLASAARRGVWPGDLTLEPLLSASLVILREFMHHAGLREIAIDENRNLVRNVTADFGHFGIFHEF